MANISNFDCSVIGKCNYFDRRIVLGIVRVLVFLVLFSVCSFLNAQQVHDFRTELYAPQWHNPASFGTWNKHSLNFLGSYRKIIPGFVSSAFMIGGEGFFELPKRTSGIGVGANYFYTTLQDIDVTRGLNLQLNYQIEFDKFSISFGAAPGFQSISRWETNWIVSDTAFDPNLPHTGTQTKFTIDAGFFFYNDKFYSGLSSAQLNSPNFDSINFQAARRYYFDTGYRFKISGNMQLFSSVSISHDGAGFRKVSGTLMFQLMKPGISFGAGYSLSNSIWALLGYEYKRFSFIYTVGMVPSVLAYSLNRNHEIRLTYKLRKKSKCSTCEYF